MNISIQGTKEAAVMQAFGAAGMFMTLTRECLNGNIPECPRAKMYRVCNAAGSSGRSASKSCSVINWDAMRKLFFSFMLSGTGGKYWRNPNRYAIRFNRAIGTVVSCPKCLLKILLATDGIGFFEEHESVSRNGKPLLTALACNNNSSGNEDG